MSHLPAGAAGTVPVPTNELVSQDVQQGEQKVDKPPPLPPRPKKVIIFGETGTGKSSLINMIADKPVAGVSNSAQGYTFENKLYFITFNENSYYICDTAGLNEGERGTVPAQQALMNLKDLILGIHEGVHLLVYCIRASRYRDILRVNYDLFHGIICQSQVPIVAVITGLENESPMAQWWKDNRSEFKQYGLLFDDCACITATKGKRLKSGEHMFQEEYDLSQKTVRRLIENSCSPTPWKMNHIQAFPQIDNQMAAYYERFNSRDGTEREALNPNNFIAQESQDYYSKLVNQIIQKVIHYFTNSGNLSGGRPNSKRSNSAPFSQPQSAMSSNNRASLVEPSMPGHYDANLVPTSTSETLQISGPKPMVSISPQKKGGKDGGYHGRKLQKPNPNAVAASSQQSGVCGGPEISITRQGAGREDIER